MIVLGIDPGLASTGFGVVRTLGSSAAALDGGVVQTAAGEPPELRLASLHDELESIFERNPIDAVAIEDLYFGQNASSALAVGQARGIALAAAGRRRIPCASYTPQQVKQAVCGSGRAAKDQVAAMVRALLGLADAPLPDHATDALAVALCHCNHAPLSRALAGAR